MNTVVDSECYDAFTAHAPMGKPQNSVSLYFENSVSFGGIPRFLLWGQI